MAERIVKEEITQMMKLAMEDLKKAIRVSGVNDDGTILAYEINGTAKAIHLAVCDLTANRINKDGNAALLEEAGFEM